jgi:U4/U6.U5 tri-snRNP-associated protein 2
MTSTKNGSTVAESKKRKAEDEISCPYLDTIQRSLLDFDFEASCSVSLESGPHVYGCLVCGKFFRGRGRQTPAYTHSVDEGHFVFVHLSKGTFHCLPDDYEIKDPSLQDISAALHPTFTSEEIARIDSNTGLARDLFARRYLPGFVGLNNLHKTDCVNAIVQALSHVKPLRDFFLSRTHKDIYIQSSKSSKKNKPPHRMSHLTQCFGELVRKMWSDKRFKSHVDPHMLIQAITVDSKKKFQVGSQAEAGEFMAWLLNQLITGLGGTRKPGSSIIHQAFQGKVQVTTRQRKVEDKPKEEEGEGETNGEEKEGETEDTPDEPVIEETTTDTHFLQLTLDIPEKPLFRDDDGGLVIPQEPLVSVLKKFDGVTFSDALSRNGAAQRKRYRLLELPQYLILHLARFKTNRYSREKNPTIVAFPVKNLDLSSYVYHEQEKEKPPTEEAVKAMDVSILFFVLHSILNLCKD